jgi:hypothetical protein
MARGASSGLSPPCSPITTVIIRQHATFLSPEGDEVRLRPGEYTVAVTAERHMHLVALDGHGEARLQAYADWHDFQLEAPLALPVAERERAPQIMLMMPGGRALIAPPPPSTGIQGVAPPIVIEVLLSHLPLALANGYPINKDILGKAKLDVTIDPSRTPTGFEPMATPPNWHGAKCAAGSGWVQGVPIGQFDGNIDQDPPPSPVGQPRYRGSFPDYYMATDTVRVSGPMLKGKVVKLHVKSWTVYLRVLAPVFFGPVDEVWEDEYQHSADANGSATFDGVVVATAHVPPYPPPPGQTWAGIAAQEYTSAGSIGSYVEFTAYLHGAVALETSVWYFNANPWPPRLFQK